MNAMSKMFASKLAPDNTINRIEELEKLWGNFNARLEGLEKNNEMVDLRARVTELEKNSKGEAYYQGIEGRIKSLEDSFAALKLGLTATSQSSGSSNLDTGAIMMRIQLLSDELNKKADKIELHELHSKIEEKIQKEITIVKNNLNDSLNGLRKEIQMLRDDLEFLRQKEIANIMERLSALEKRLTVMQQAMGNMKGGPAVIEHVSGNDDAALRELSNRVT